jgi:hypothetical protein
MQFSALEGCQKHSIIILSESCFHFLASVFSELTATNFTIILLRPEKNLLLFSENKVKQGGSATLPKIPFQN